MTRSPNGRVIRTRHAAAHGSRAGRKVTISDIAEATALSKATISLVLRNSPSIPEVTRERVLEAASRLGYVYHRGAASLRGGQTRTVGIVVNDINNPYFAEIVALIQQKLTTAGRFSFLCNTDEDLKVQSGFVEKMREYNVDGIIMSPAEGTDPQWLRQLGETGMPVALFSRYIDSGVDSVSPDNVGGMRLAMEHLVELGHRRIAMVGANERNSTGIDRLAGYLKAVKVARLPEDERLIKYALPSREAGFKAARELMELADKPTAIVCFNDVLAFGVMLGLRSLGLSPGREVSVIGFDDIAESSLWLPALTSIKVSVAALAEEASQLLLTRVSQAHPSSASRILLPVSLAVRETTGRAPPEG